MEREAERRRKKGSFGTGQKEKMECQAGLYYRKKLTVCDDVEESVPQQLETPKIQLAPQNNLIIPLEKGPVLGESNHYMTARHVITENSRVTSKEFSPFSPACLTQAEPNFLPRCSTLVNLLQNSEQNLIFTAGARQEMVGGASMTGNRAKCLGTSSGKLRQMCERHFPKISGSKFLWVEKTQRQFGISAISETF